MPTTSISDRAAKHLRTVQAECMIHLKRRVSYEEMILTIKSETIQ